MVQDDSYQKLKDYALKLLSFRPRSKKEIRGRLIQFSIKKGIPAKVAAAVIEDLISQNLINDEEFASWWKEQRGRIKPKGVRIIRSELRQKGISKEIIDKVLQKSKDFQDNELEKAKRLALKRVYAYRHLGKKEMRAKLGNYLLRRGFDWDIVLKVIDSVL